MKVALGSDHAGFALKTDIASFLETAGHQVQDLGTHSPDSCDYPDFAGPVASRVAQDKADRGILVCATGVGMAMAANKVPGIRAAVCNDFYTARYARLHNNANVLAVGARVLEPAKALAIVALFMDTDFEGGRHERRLQKISALEQQYGRCDT